MHIFSAILLFLAFKCDGSFIRRPLSQAKWNIPATLMSPGRKTAYEALSHTQHQNSTSSDIRTDPNLGHLNNSNDLLLTQVSSEAPALALNASHLSTDYLEPPYSKSNPRSSQKIILKQTNPSSSHNRPQNVVRHSLQRQATRTEPRRDARSAVNQYINWQHPDLQNYESFEGTLDSLNSALRMPAELDPDGTKTAAISGLVERITQSDTEPSDVLMALSQFHQMSSPPSHSTPEEEFSGATYSRRDGEPYTAPSYSHSGPPGGSPEHRVVEEEPEDKKTKVMTKIATIGLWGALAAGTISLGLFRGRSLEPGLFNYLWEAGKLGLGPEEEDLDNIYETVLKGADAAQSDVSDIKMERHQVVSHSNRSHLVEVSQKAGNLTSGGNITERGDWLPVLRSEPQTHINVTRSQATERREDKHQRGKNESSSIQLTQGGITEKPKEKLSSESNLRSYHEWTSSDQREDNTDVRAEHRHGRQARSPYAVQRKRAYEGAHDRRYDARFGNTFSGSFGSRNDGPYEVIYEDPYNTKRPSKGSFFDISFSDVAGLFSTSFVLAALGLSFYLGAAAPYSTTTVVANTTTNGTNVNTNAQITTSGTDTVTVTNTDTDTLTNTAPASITNTPSNTNTPTQTDTETITNTVTDSSTITNNQGASSNTNTNNG